MSITDKELEKISTSKGLEGTLYSHSLVVSMAKELLAYRKAEQEGLIQSPNWDNIPSGVVSRRLASAMWEYIDSLRKMADIYLDGLSALSSLTDKSKRCNIHSVG